MKRLIAALAISAAINGVAVQAQDFPLPAETRWAVMIDASDASALNEKTDAARAKFCEELCAAGVPKDHIFTYATNAKDEAERPTRKNIETILEELRDVSGVVGLDDGDETRYWRGDGDDAAPCEVQFYITAKGVSFNTAQGTRNFLLPCDVQPEEITGPDDERLLDVATIEEALATPEEGTPIDRVFLVINFLSTETATRGVGKASGLRDVVVKDVPTRSVYDEEETAANVFSYVRILTKNERLDDETVDSFYQTIAQWMSGYADLARNRDGWVGAVELAEYALDNGREKAVDFAFNGSATYSIAPSRREANVPRELFAQLEAALVAEENRALRESARKRKEQTGKKSVRPTTRDDFSGSGDATTRSGKGGVLR